MGGIVGGAIGAVTNIIAGNKAADAQKDAARVNRKQFAETKELLSPYTNVGPEALDMYKTGVGLNGAARQTEYFNNFQNDPGFKAAEAHATRGIENSNALRGRGYGGNVIAGLGDYLQKNMLGAYQQRQSQLGGLVDTGRQAAQSLGGLGAQSAATQGQHLANAGYYQGAGIAGAGQSFLNAMGGQQQAGAYGQGASGGGLSSAGNFLSMFGG
jgi:hypothetical protein